MILQIHYELLFFLISDECDIKSELKSEFQEISTPVEKVVTGQIQSQISQLYHSNNKPVQAEGFSLTVNNRIDERSAGMISGHREYRHIRNTSQIKNEGEANGNINKNGEIMDSGEIKSIKRENCLEIKSEKAKYVKMVSF